MLRIGRPTATVVALLWLSVLSLALLAWLPTPAVVHGQDADESGDPPPRLQLPRATDGRTIEWDAREIIRNGDFRHLDGAWAMSGATSFVSENASRRGADRDAGAHIGVSQALGGTNGGLVQELLLPTTCTRVVVSFHYRLGAETTDARLQGFAASIGQFVGANFRELAPLVAITPANYPGVGWQQVSVTLSDDQLATLNGVHAAGGRVMLVMRVIGDGMALHVDDVSVRVSGTQTIPAIPGVIAFALTPPDGTGLRLELVNADGSDRRTALVASEERGHCKGLAWRPDGGALAFSSDHELGWSGFTADVYETTGTRTRRLTNAPGRDWLAATDRPTGRVTVTVRNLTAESQELVGVYVRGARTPAFVSLAPHDTEGDEASVTLDDVVDLGPGVLQTVSVRVGEHGLIAANGVDVKPGETVEHVGPAMVTPQMPNIQVVSPSWHRSGERLACSVGGLKTLPRAGGVPGTDVFGNVSGFRPAWSPVDDRLLYLSTDFTIWMTAPDAGQPTKLVEAGQPFNEHPAWLPDGSGFLFVRDTRAGDVSGRNIFAYSFDHKRAAPLTEVLSERLDCPTPSPDGRFVAFTRTLPAGLAGREVVELWVMQTDKPTHAWRIDVAGTPRFPVWSPRDR